MSETPIYRPFQLQWPLTQQAVEDLNATIDDIYELLKQRAAADAPAHTLLSEVHTDTTPATEVDGDLIVGQGGKFARFAKGANGEHLRMAAGAPDWDTDGSTLTALNASNITSGTLDAARLADSGVVAGSYGDATHVPRVTVDAKGRITTVVEVAITTTHNLLSSTHLDTVAATVQLGDLVVGQNSGSIDVGAYFIDGQPFEQLPNANDPGTEAFWRDGLPAIGLITSGAVKWARKANGTAGYVLTAGATGPDWQPNSGSGGSGAAIYRAADLTVSFDTLTTIDLDTSIFNDGFWTSGSRLTVPSGKAGRYVIVGATGSDYAFVGDWHAMIYINGVRKAMAKGSAGTTVVGDVGVVQVVEVADLAVGDYVELVVRWSYGGGHPATTILKGGLTNTFLKMVRV